MLDSVTIPVYLVFSGWICLSVSSLCFVWVGLYCTHPVTHIYSLLISFEFGVPTKQFTSTGWICTVNCWVSENRTRVHQDHLIFVVLFCFLEKGIFQINWNHQNFLAFIFSPRSWQIYTCPSTKSNNNTQPTFIHHVCKPIRSWEWILFTDLPGKESGQKSLCGSSRQATWVEALVHNSHGIHVLFKHQIEYCRNRCWKCVYVRLDIAVNQMFTHYVTDRAGISPWQRSHLDSDFEYIHKCKSHAKINGTCDSDWLESPQSLCCQALFFFCFVHVAAIYKLKCVGSVKYVWRAWCQVLVPASYAQMILCLPPQLLFSISPQPTVFVLRGLLVIGCLNCCLLCMQLYNTVVKFVDPLFSNRCLGDQQAHVPWGLCCVHAACPGPSCGATYAGFTWNGHRGHDGW